jgi:hypothetical protein
VRSSSFIGALAASAIGAGAAQGQALDQDFRTLCVSHKGEALAALATAEAAGWITLPSGATPPTLPGGAKLKTFAMRLHSVGAATHLLVVGEGEAKSDPKAEDGELTNVRVCFVASPQADSAGVTAEKAALQGEPAFRDPQALVYLVDQATGRVSPLKGRAAAAQMKAGALAAVMLVDTPQATAFGYQVPEPIK